MLEIIIDKPQAGAQNMQKDAELFRALEGDIRQCRPQDGILRIYQWQPQCISLGYSQDPDKFLNVKECQNQGWDIVKRLTGGGIVFHNADEITYSLFLPKNHPKLPKGIIPSCNFISDILVKSLNDIGLQDASLASKKGLGNNRGSAICFARPTKYEIVVDDKKIVGSAQKQGEKYLMQHGSICIKKNDPSIEKCLKTKHIDNSIGINDLNNTLTGQKIIDTLVSAFKKEF